MVMVREEPEEEYGLRSVTLYPTVVGSLSSVDLYDIWLVHLSLVIWLVYLWTPGCLGRAAMDNWLSG